MRINQAFRYELDPNDAQRTAFAKHAGAARFAYNWALARRIRLFEESKGKARFTNAIAQHRELNVLKKSEYPWMYDVSKCAPQEALRNLDAAFKAFWRDRKRGRKHGFPKFKKRGVNDSFRLTGSIRVFGRAIRLPRLGTIRLKESTGKFDGRILSATVRREADRWYVSLQVERMRFDPAPVSGPLVGVDLGLEAFAVVSDGIKIESPKPLTKSLQRLRRLSRSHSRKKRGSNNRKRSAMRLARLYRNIRNIRTDFIHKATTMLAKTKSAIVVEDLSVRNLIRNRYLARAISDAGWSEFRRQVACKCAWYGSELVVAPKHFASTRRCSSCGIVGPKLDLSCRIFCCGSCGYFAGRDENAARNLAWYGQFGRNLTPAERPLSAERARDARSTRYDATKQEANVVYPSG
jgi:putative transposase